MQSVHTPSNLSLSQIDPCLDHPPNSHGADTEKARKDDLLARENVTIKQSSKPDLSFRFSLEKRLQTRFKAFIIRF